MLYIRGNEKLSKEQLQALIGKIRALIYARVSSEDQVKNFSLESQIQLCIEYALREGIPEEEIIVTVEEGESGDDPNRPTLNYAMFLLEYGIADQMVILHPNRFSRQLFLQTQVTHKVWSLGKDVRFVEFNLDRDNPESMLNYNIQGSISEYNKAKILQDTKRGRMTMVKNKQIPGINRIYGYLFDKVNDTLIENPIEKAVYLQMVDWLLNDNCSCSEIARRLHTKPAPSGNKWYQTTVSRILNNETYTGKYHYGKTKVTKDAASQIKQLPQPRETWLCIPVPAFIDEETHNRILERLGSLNKRKGGRPSEDYLLRGLAKCGRCGASVSSGVTTKTKERLLKYYTCTRKSKKYYTVGTGEPNEVCRGRNWRVDQVDEFIWDYVVTLIRNPKEHLINLAKQQMEEGNLEELRSRRAKLKKEVDEKDNVKKRYNELFAAGFIKTLDELQEKVDEVERELNGIISDLKNVEEVLNTSSANHSELQLMSDMMLSYQGIIESDTITIEDKKKLVNTIIRGVTLKDDGKLEITLHLKKMTDPHNNINNGQSDGLSFYVYSKIDYIRPKTLTQERSNWALHENRLAELTKLYTEELLTFEEIGRAVGINWWTVKKLFDFYNVPRIGASMRNKLKRGAMKNT